MTGSQEAGPVPGAMLRRVLIVGQGSIGQLHLRLARRLLPEADIRVLRHRQDTVTPHEADGVFSRLEDAAAFSPQLAVVANAAPFHLPTATTLAALGAHLLVEKPLSDRTDGCDDLARALAAGGGALLVGYNLRFLPSLQRFRAAVQGGVVGRVLSVRCEIGQHLSTWRPGRDYRETVSARKSLGGGVLLELSHEFDYLRWIFGEVVRVSADVGRLSDLDIDVEDSAHVLVRFAPDAAGRSPVGMIGLDFVRQDVTRVCTAIGEQGTLRWNAITGTVEHFTSGSWHTLFVQPPQREDSYLAEWRHLLACAAGEERPLVTLDDGRQVLAVIEAARLASETGCWQPVQTGAVAAGREP